MLRAVRTLSRLLRWPLPEAADSGFHDPLQADAGAQDTLDTHRELLRLHARILQRLPLIEALLVGGVALIVLPRVRLGIFLGWAGATLAIEALRAGMATRLLRRADAIDVPREHSRFAAAALVAGLANGMAAPLFMHRIGLLPQAMIGVMLYVMPSAGVSAAVSSRRILAGYAFGLLLPAAWAWAALHPEDGWGVAVLTLVYWAFLLAVSTDGERLLQRSIRIRKQRDRMVLELQQSNAEAGSARERAEQAAQARSRVLAAASHDLRQPLHALSVNSAILSTHPPPELLGEVAGNIDAIVGSLGSLLDGLLDLSRLSAGLYQPQAQAFDLHALLRELCGEFRGAATAKGLRLELDCPALTLRGDVGALTRMVRNLLDNAVKYTDAGTIAVAASQTNGAAQIRVSDTGRGIAPQHQQRIFEEFYQVGNPGRDRGQGVGLGLSIVQRLGELTHTGIALQSSPGVGSSFTLSLPWPIEPPAVAASAADSAAAPELRGLRVLVLDDEAEVLRATSRLLTRWGAQVRTAASPAQADAELLQHGAPDLLIADLRLGAAEDGAAFALRLRPRHGHIPVLIVSGENAPHTALRMRAEGLVLLRKPVAAATLRAAMLAARKLAGADPAIGGD